ncbi:hypothetical protein AGMMS50230_00660 [Spirochaetia bacterium]|nr:hypothetical protein AGMMS50230_00660 [Spirochaetia bacterium]
MFNAGLFLQIWGGFFYLLAKLLLAFSEDKAGSKKLRISGWISYLSGIPAWVIILAGNNDWVVAAVELGSIPSMVLGILTAWRPDNAGNKIFVTFVRFFTFFTIIAGTSYSIYYFHGITTFSQVLEILITIGFLLGSYLLAKNNTTGWLLFVLMCISMILLMVLQDKLLLASLQGVSLIVVLTGYIKAIKRKHYKR